MTIGTAACVTLLFSVLLLIWTLLQPGGQHASSAVSDIAQIVGPMLILPLPPKRWHGFRFGYVGWTCAMLASSVLKPVTLKTLQRTLAAVTK
jgi:hypothetical protein